MCARLVVAPADDERRLEAEALHLAGDVGHLVQTRSDEAAQADHVDLVLLGGVEDFFARAHHAEVDDLEVVTGQYHAHDVLADVVHVALHRGHEDLALGAAFLDGLGGFFGLHVGHQVGDGLLHHPRAFDHLRQEHLARAEEVAHHAHARHERAFDHVERALRLRAGFLGVAINEIRDALDQRVREAFLHGAAAPGVVFLFRLIAGLLGLEGFSDFHEALGGVGTAVEQHVFHALQQVLGNIFVDGEHARVDDAHIHPGADRMVEKGGVHRLAHGGIAPEGKGDVRDAARDVCAGQVLANPARRLDEIDRVVVVLLNARGDREDVRIEDDVLRRKSRLPP